MIKSSFQHKVLHFQIKYKQIIHNIKIYTHKIKISGEYVDFVLNEEN